MVENAADGELVRRIAQGTPAPDAEAELCRRFAPRIRLYGLRHLKTEDRAADLAQSALLAVLEAARAGRIAQLEHVERFVLGTCRNLAQRIREREVRTVPTAPEAFDIGSYLPDFERVHPGALGRCLNKLDARSRAIVLQSFHAERSAEEIAAQLELSPGNVRVLRHRALLQLRQCLTDPKAARP
jgi:RNA polymerase sigma-70 factor (ECF subfamily)